MIKLLMITDIKKDERMFTMICLITILHFKNMYCIALLGWKSISCDLFYFFFRPNLFLWTKKNNIHVYFHVIENTWTCGDNANIFLQCVFHASWIFVKDILGVNRIGSIPRLFIKHYWAHRINNLNINYYNIEKNCIVKLYDV